MIPHKFVYSAPESVAACVAALAEGGRVMAGGTWVLPEMGRGESAPERVVHLRRAGLDGISVVGDTLQVGATVTYAALLQSEAVARHAPLLEAMAGVITGGWALRNQATLGGSAMAARPQSDAPGALVACGATACLSGPAGERRVPVAELFVAAMRTTLRPGELLTAFELPSAAGAGVGYHKVKRYGSSWPIASGAAVVALDEEGRCRSTTLVLGAVAETPLRVELGHLVGQRPDEVDVRTTDAAVAAALTAPWGDALAPPEYRASVALPVARRALTAALQDAQRREDPR